MKNAVIYPRFSSHGQNEQSIEGQIRICKEYAESQGLRVVNVYPEKARTGTTDSRPAFQRMIEDAKSGAYQYIIVYMFDRFARNRKDSMMYKEMLKEKYGIKVLSATQPISDDEGGELYEMFVEWNDERYSKRLSKRVREGIDTMIENGTFSGGYLIYGYKTVQSAIVGKKGQHLKEVAIDEEQAAIMWYVFEQYDKGVEKKEIAAALNAQGHRLNGKLFTGKSFDKWIVNERYTGEFMFGGRLCSKMFPAIIDKALFVRVQERLRANMYFAGGAATAKREPYLLTGKVRCGLCKTDMVAGGGTSKTGKVYYSYACKTMKKGACEKKREGKDTLELGVTESVRDFMSDPKNADRAVTDTLSYYDKKTGIDSIKSVESKIAHARQEVEEMATAYITAKSDLLRATIERRMADQEVLIKDLHFQKAQLELERGYKITKQDLLDFIADLLKGDPNDKEYQRQIIDNLVTMVYVYDTDIIVLIKLQGGRTIEHISVEEISTAVEGIIGVQTQLPPPRQVR